MYSNGLSDLAPLALYIFWSRRWTGVLAWYYLNVFCAIRIIGGALGIHDSNSMAANVISTVGISPLVLTIDGLLHEVRPYRNPYHNKYLAWFVVALATGLMAVAIALSVIGSLDIYENHAKPDSLSQWKAGMALIVVTWVLEVFWALFAFLPSQSRKDVATYQGGTALLRGALIAQVFIGIRVIYGLVVVCTQERALSPIYGTVAVRVVLMFLPEVLAAVTVIFVGLQTRHVRQKSI